MHFQQVSEWVREAGWLVSDGDVEGGRKDGRKKERQEGRRLDERLKKQVEDMKNRNNEKSAFSRSVREDE